MQTDKIVFVLAEIETAPPLTFEVLRKMYALLLSNEVHLFPRGRTLLVARRLTFTAFTKPSQWGGRLFSVHLPPGFPGVVGDQPPFVDSISKS